VVVKGKRNAFVFILIVTRCWPMIAVLDCLVVTKRGAEVEKGEETLP